MKVLGIIPARYGSSRLEGKPLLDIAGKTMIRRVYEKAILAKKLHKIIVATDYRGIQEECEKYQIPVMMTSASHINGTERCGEVLEHIGEDFDVILNIQGDEPFIHPESIDELITVFENNPNAEIGTLIKVVYVYPENVQSDIGNPNYIKVVTDCQNKALYFSRSIIPSMRDAEKLTPNYKLEFKKHIGMYGFKTNVLKKIIKLEESPLEKTEKLEQLRWLENGYSIFVGETKHESKSIDTIEDYIYILKNISQYTNE